MRFYQVEVSAGASLLDRKDPGWEWRVDLSKLGMFSACDCVLGQLHGNVNKGLRFIGLESLSSIYASSYGFTLGSLPACLIGFITFPILTGEWKIQIEARRAKLRVAA